MSGSAGGKIAKAFLRLYPVLRKNQKSLIDRLQDAQRDNRRLNTENRNLFIDLERVTQELEDCKKRCP